MRQNELKKFAKQARSRASEAQRSGNDRRAGKLADKAAKAEKAIGRQDSRASR